MKWNPFEYQGQVYDLSHLHPFEWEYTAPSGDKHPERTYRFQVNFGMHCFSRDPLDGEQVDSTLFYQGPKERRVFCFDRHEWSRQLPDIIRSLGERTCWHTHHGNYFTIEFVTRSGDKVEYEVYFDVTRATRKGWLNLVVQTAYVRDERYATSQPRKRKIRLDVIAYNKQMGKKIRPGR